MENCSKKPRLVLTPNGQLKQEAADHETSREVVVDDATLPVTKMAIVIDKTMYDCPLCYRPLRPPVLKCRAGHGACGSCSENHSRKCHLCADGAEYEHIHWLDPYVMEAKVPCPNEPFGCRTLVTYFLVDDHRLECRHAPCYCPEPGCTFPGSPLMLYDHLKVHHDWLVTSIAFNKKLDLEIDEAERRRLLATENGEHLFLLVITERVGGGCEVRLVRVCGKDAGPWGYWYKVWTNAPMDPWYGDKKPILMLEDRVRSCAVPSEEAAMEVGSRYLSVQLPDMHPRGGFALRVRITRYQLQTADGASAPADPVSAGAD